MMKKGFEIQYDGAVASGTDLYKHRTGLSSKNKLLNKNLFEAGSFIFNNSAHQC